VGGDGLVDLRHQVVSSGCGTSDLGRSQPYTLTSATNIVNPLTLIT
jgi:hypothetical protein